MRVAYVSYDGALDPLGSSQVVPYLEGLSGRGVRFELITFEKPFRFEDGARRASMSARLKAAGIAWHPLRYHKSPRVPATLFDVAAGALLLRRLAQREPFDLIHCRGEIPPMMVRLARLVAPLLLDMRGFFADERVDAGSWRAGSLVDRAVRAAERGNLARASRVVVLTDRGRDVLRKRGVAHPIDVIPTCVDCEQFAPAVAGADVLFDLVYFGSLGGWYMTKEMIEFVTRLRDSGSPLRVLFLTNNVDGADEAQLKAAGATVQSATPEDVPGWLSKCRAAFFFIRASPSKMASCPTKLAEALAMGLPVLTGAGVGDVDRIVREGQVGVVLDDYSADSYRRGWRAMTTLLDDPETRARCRAVALASFSLVGAVEKYWAAYDHVVRRPH